MLQNPKPCNEFEDCREAEGGNSGSCMVNVSTGNGTPTPPSPLDLTREREVLRLNDIERKLRRRKWWKTNDNNKAREGGKTFQLSSPMPLSGRGIKRPTDPKEGEEESVKASSFAYLFPLPMSILRSIFLFLIRCCDAEQMFVSMLRGMSHREKANSAACRLVAVAIDKDKSSQSALKWALDNVVTRGQTLTLIHVNTRPSCKMPYPCSSRGAYANMILAWSIHAERCKIFFLINCSFSFRWDAAGYRDDASSAAISRDVFIPFRCFCTRKDVSHLFALI